jgi:hypothetical protein
VQIEDGLPLDTDLATYEVVARFELRQPDGNTASFQCRWNTGAHLADISVYRHSMRRRPTSMATDSSQERNGLVPTLRAYHARSPCTWKFPPEGRKLP